MSRSPDGSSTRLSCAAPRLSLQSAVRANASKPNSGSSAAAFSTSKRCRCFGSRLGMAVATMAVAALPSTRKPVSDSRRAPRQRRWSCSTSFGISRPRACAAASGWAAGSSSLSSARGGGSLGTAVSGSGLRPSIRSSASACGTDRGNPSRRKPPTSGPEIFSRIIPTTTASGTSSPASM